MQQRALVACLALCACRMRFDELSDASTNPSDDADAFVEFGDPSAVKLVTKHLYGSPQGAFTIAWTGGDAANLRLRFVDRAHRVVHTSDVASDGGVTLPAKAGLYQVQLRDPTTGGISYAQAIVTNPVATFTSIQTAAVTQIGRFAPHWPYAALEVADVDGDGVGDLVHLSGQSGVEGLAGSGVFIQPWNTDSGQFDPETLVPMPERRHYGFALFDNDADGDLDIVLVSQVLATFDLELCELSNDGSGTYGAPACTVLDDGTMTDNKEAVGSLAAADFDRDGRIDLVVAGVRVIDSVQSAAELRVLRNTSAGFVVAKSWSAPGEQFGGMAIADVNDDGRLDVLTNGGTPSRLRVFNAVGSFEFSEPIAWQSAHGEFTYDGITPAYIDDNSTLDILLTHPDGPSTVFYSDGTTLTPMAIPTFAEEHGARFHVLDLDIDGETEVFIPYKNRFLTGNTIGGMRKPASTLLQATTPNASNSIVGSQTTPSWALNSNLFGDWDDDGSIDALQLIAFTMQLEVLRGN